jgi:hypothetical protein
VARLNHQICRERLNDGRPPAELLNLRHLEPLQGYRLMRRGGGALFSEE